MYFDEAFAQEVRANPQDNMARLILADYLDDQGNPLAEFIRIQLQIDEASNSPSNVGENLQLELRERELLESYGEVWLEPLRKLGAQGVSIRCFRRGLVERIKISADDFVQNGEEIMRISPGLHVLQLRDVRKSKLYSQLRIPNQIRTVDLSSCGLGASNSFPGLSQIQASWMGDVEGITLDFNNLTDEDVLYLTALFRNLRSLSLSVNRLTATSVEAIVNSVSLSSLEELHLNANQLDGSACQAIARAPYLSRLRSLNLASNSIGSEGAHELFQASNLPELKVLNLRSCRISNSLPEVINYSTLVRQLELLDLRNNHNSILANLSEEVLAKLGAA